MYNRAVLLKMNLVLFSLLKCSSCLRNPRHGFTLNVPSFHVVPPSLSLHVHFFILSLQQTHLKENSMHQLNPHTATSTLVSPPLPQTANPTLTTSALLIQDGLMAVFPPVVQVSTVVLQLRTSTAA